MSIYDFSPCSQFNLNHSFLTWDCAFTDEQINKIVEYGDSLKKNKAIIDGAQEEDNFDKIRKSKVAWIANNSETFWIYDTLAYVARQLNSQFYNFNLTGFFEDMQYTVYESNTADHYDWHTDINPPYHVPRKMSLILQLSDPSDYEGGNVETLNCAIPSVIEKKKGLIAAFPSWMLHRVTPVTKGIRKTLVVWIAGPQFV